MYYSIKCCFMFGLRVDLQVSKRPVLYILKLHFFVHYINTSALYRKYGGLNKRSLFLGPFSHLETTFIILLQLKIPYTFIVENNHRYHQTFAQNLCLQNNDTAVDNNYLFAHRKCWIYSNLIPFLFISVPVKGPNLFLWTRKSLSFFSFAVL